MHTQHTYIPISTYIWVYYMSVYIQSVLIIHGSYFHKVVKNTELKTIETLLYNIYRVIFLEASVLNIFIKQSVYKLALHVLLLKNNLFTIYC